MVSFVVAMNRVDVGDLVVDLVDVGLVHVVPAVFFIFWPPAVFLAFGPRLFFGLLAPGCFLGCWPPSVLARASPRLFFGLLGSSLCSIFQN